MISPVLINSFESRLQAAVVSTPAFMFTNSRLNAGLKTVNQNDC